MTTVQDLNALTTEGVDPRFADIDTLGVAELAALMNEADQSVPIAVHAALGQIVPAIEEATERLRRGGRLVYVGAGTPGRIGVLDASEIPPTFSEHGRVLGIIAGGPSAIVDAAEGAEDDESAGARAIDDAGIDERDAVIGIAASGRTPFVIGAVRRARELGAVGIGLSCNARTPLSEVADHGIEVIVGPEFVSGSTRLKAGTAQKLVLNMFSTIGMVRLGKTYGNLMVDVHASNEKLRARATRLVSQIAGSSEDRAREALEDCGFSVPVAVLMIGRGLTAEAALERLDQAHGHLRSALEDTGRDAADAEDAGDER